MQNQPQLEDGLNAIPKGPVVLIGYDIEQLFVDYYKFKQQLLMSLEKRFLDPNQSFLDELQLGPSQHQGSLTGVQEEQKVLEDIEDSQVNFDIKCTLNDQAYFNLPSMSKIQIESEEFEYQLSLLPEDVQGLMRGLKDFINSKVFKWEVNDLPRSEIDFNFTLPPTGFNSKTPIIQYQQTNFTHEYNQVQPLNQSQIASIIETGEFQIPSRNFPIPYTWRLSQWVVKGKKYRYDSFHHDLSISYHQILQMRQRIYRPPYDGDKRPDPCIYHGLKNILIPPVSLVSLLLGYLYLYPNINENAVHNKIEKRRQDRLNQLDQFQTDIFEYLSIMDINMEQQEKDVESRMTILNNIFTKFKNGLQERLGDAITDAYEDHSQKEEVFQRDEEEEKEIQQFRDKIDKSCLKDYNIIIDFSKDIAITKQEVYHIVIKQLIMENDLIDEKIKLQLINLIEWQQLYEYFKNRMEYEVQQARTKITDELREDHPIKSRVELYREKQLETRMAPIQKQLKIDLEKQLEETLQHNYPNQSKLYSDFLKWNAHYHLKYEEEYEKHEKKVRTAAKSFIVTRQLLPPYRIQQYESGCEVRYRLVREQDYETKTDYYGWRIWLGFVRWFAWSFNCFYGLFVIALVGPLGIRALFGCKEFNPDVEINATTGIVKPSSYSFATVMSTFVKVLEGMSDSRNQFENRPDTGFFGKNLARICNLIEVYIFRLLFVGVILVLICFPIVIILNVAISIVLALTSWIWIPIYLLIRFLFCFLLYDIDGINQHNVRNSQFIPSKWFPFFFEIFRLIVFVFNIFDFQGCFLIDNSDNCFNYYTSFLCSIYDDIWRRQVYFENDL